ncbi:MAG: putative porin [Woeseia sp.]
MTKIAVALLVAMIVAAPEALAQASWTETIKLSGDTRVRYESIDAEGSANRDRSRFRARFGLEAKAADDIKLVFRLATGDGSPVSTNLTMDDGFSAKQILVDRAYVDWRLNDQWNVMAGKMKTPWFRAGGTPLLWDGDLNPEGIALLGDNGNFFGSLSAMSVEERSSSDDSLLLAAQGGWKGKLGDSGSLTAGLGYFNYTDTKGQSPFYDGDANGNTVDLAGNYVFDYELVEVFAEYKTKFNDLPLTVYADVVQNSGANNGQDLGWTFGATVGKASAPGTTQFGYAWLDTEADAVIGTFNDSDFAGGVTDARGHLIQAKYAIRDNVALGGTLILTERGEFAGPAQDYNRLMLDIEFSFK